jgi:hypothetical protein
VFLKNGVSCFETKKLFFVLPKLCALIPGFFGTEISEYPYEVSKEVSVERKPEKFSKFQAKINYCVFFSSRLVFWLNGNLIPKLQHWTDDEQPSKDKQQMYSSWPLIILITISMKIHFTIEWRKLPNSPSTLQFCSIPSRMANQRR